MTNNNSPKTGHLCACYCNQVITSKATYKPGHDAAHVSQLLQGLRNQEADHGIETVTEALIQSVKNELPSAALQRKFVNAANRLYFAEKVVKTAKAKTEEWHPVDTEVAKVGRWTYPVRELVKVTTTGDQPLGVFQRNTKRDGSGEWVLVDTENLVAA